MSEQPRCTKWRDRFSQMSLIHVPRVCDDVEVQKFLNGYFLEFRPDHASAKLNAVEVFAAARAKFGDLRCDSVKYWEH
jgi:hypothetical protein